MKTKPPYQNLFDFMYNHFGITLLQSEMQCIIKTCKQYDEPTLLGEVEKLRDDYASQIIELTPFSSNLVKCTIMKCYEESVKELTKIINKHKQ